MTGWPDPSALAVKVIVVRENHRRKGIGTALLKHFDSAARKLGFESFVLGARLEAIPFYESCGLRCFANVQVPIDRIPWERLEQLAQRYRIKGGVVFSPWIEKSF